MWSPRDESCRETSIGRSTRPGPWGMTSPGPGNTYGPSRRFDGVLHFHRVGHGLGIEGHEAPSVVTDNAMVVEPGLTFTVEPGIYIPILGSLRAEENVAVKKDGVDALTAYLLNTLRASPTK